MCYLHSVGIWISDITHCSLSKKMTLDMSSVRSSFLKMIIRKFLPVVLQDLSAIYLSQLDQNTNKCSTLFSTQDSSLTRKEIENQFNSQEKKKKDYQCFCNQCIDLPSQEHMLYTVQYFLLFCTVWMPRINPKNLCVNFISLYNTSLPLIVFQISSFLCLSEYDRLHLSNVNLLP